MISFSNLGALGRLGNSLFQVSATIALALRNNDKYVFPPWEYERHFNLHGCFSNSIQYKKQYREPFFHYQPIPYEPELDLFGFFQSTKYFEDFSDVIISLMTPKDGFGILQNTASIHVRRGDYVNNSAYEQLGTDYYRAAMNLIKSKHYLVVSDDIPWCRRQFIGEQFTFAENNDPVTDLKLQIACENNIICNSSFSWWGAYLNKLPSKTVIAPKRWFGPALSHDTKDLLPESWIKIDG